MEGFMAKSDVSCPLTQVRGWLNRKLHPAVHYELKLDESKSKRGPAIVFKIPEQEIGGSHKVEKPIEFRCYGSRAVIAQLERRIKPPLRRAS